MPCRVRLWYAHRQMLRMTGGGRPRVPGAVAIVATVLFASVSARPIRADPAEVERLIDEGNQLRRQGQSGRALPLFQKAYTLAHTPRTEAQLGLVEMDAGYYVEAEKHLASALDFPQYPFIAANRDGLEKALARARSQIGEIEITGEPAGAAVAINGEEVGKLPLGSPVRIAMGRVDVAVTASGHSPWSRSVALRGAERVKLTVKLEVVGTAASGVPGMAPSAAMTTAGSAVGAPAAASVEPASMPGMRVAAWALAGGAVLALGGGLVLQLGARSARDDFSASCYREGNQTLVKTNIIPMPTLDTCNGFADRWETDRAWSIVGYATGGALAITSAILFWQTWPSRTGGPVHARLGCAPALSGMFCRGEF